MLKFSYFWIMIVVSFSFFLIGTYKNIVTKIVYVFWLNNPDHNGKNDQGTPVALPLPKKRTIINEALLQKSIKEKSFYLWVRHVLIFFGFVFLFLFDGLYYFCIKLFEIEYFVIGAGRGFVKFGLELSGVVLFIGLVLGIIHRVIFAKEYKLEDIWFILLLFVVVLTGFLTEVFRFVIEPNDAFIRYSFIARPLSVTLGRIQWPWNFLNELIWMVHATSVGLFFAYLPYSKFVHIFVTPIGKSFIMARDIAMLKMKKMSGGLL